MTDELIHSNRTRDDSEWREFAAQARAQRRAQGLSEPPIDLDKAAAEWREETGAEGFLVLGVEVKGITEITEPLQLMKAELPEILWVVVVDGGVDTFVETVCRQIKETHEECKFWLVGSGEIALAESSPLAALDPLRLNPLNDDDAKFLRNLVADLVIVPSEPKDSQRTRVERWLHQSKYILVEKLEASVVQEIQCTGGVSGGSNAEEHKSTRMSEILGADLSNTNRRRAF